MSDSIPARDVTIDCDGRQLRGILAVPVTAKSVVAFAHGSGSGRHSQRNQFVASELQKAGLGTLLLDLLQDDEASDRTNVFDIALLASSLNCAAQWLESQIETQDLPIAYFGASTGAAAALVAAADRPEAVYAVVSRGGRPDLAGRHLAQVKVPTLLIVGGNDRDVLELNQQALHELTCVKKLIVVPGATHLFPEPGALELVADHAKNWFLQSRLGPRSR